MDESGHFVLELANLDFCSKPFHNSPSPKLLGIPVELFRFLFFLLKTPDTQESL